MTSESTTRFSEDELGQCQNWSLPDVSSEKLIPSAEKEARDRKKQLEESAQEHVEPVNTEAGELIEESIEAVQPLTVEQLQEITENAEKEGYQAGYDKGLKAGKQEGKTVGEKAALLETKAHVAKQCENLQHIVDALMIPIQTEQRELQGIMLDMVCQLAKAVVKRELLIDSSQITSLIDVALRSVPTGVDKFTLIVNRQDLALIQQHLKESPQTIDKHFTFHVDDNLLPGGCRLESQQTTVDCTVEQRLQEIIDGFLHKQFVAADNNTVESKNKHISSKVVKEDPQRTEEKTDNPIKKEAKLQQDEKPQADKNIDQSSSGKENPPKQTQEKPSSDSPEEEA